MPGTLEAHASGGPQERTLHCYLPAPLLQWLARTPEDLVRTCEGTVLFADLSGFTRLSERLARSGREGAELLTDAITVCFTALLSDAYGNGGTLLKFGGDALLLWFEGPEDAARACASALAMRRTLRDVGQIRAGSAQVVLRMSVGVHSGTYQMFLVGGSHREFMLAGPAASRAVRLEGYASSGQILLSPETAALVPPSCLGAPCAPGTLLARAPAFDPITPATIEMPSDEAVGACFSTEVRAHLRAAAGTPEHRTATIAFVQFGELDRLIGERGERAVATALDELVRCVQVAADRYQVCFLGSDVNPDGGKLLLTAGAPRMLGDDEERMLLALRAVIDAEPSLRVRVGVNRGHVFMGEVGPPWRRTYTAMGDTVNLAARVMARAPWRTIYATQGLLDRARWRFATTAVPPFHVKGKTRRVEAWDVGAALGAGAPGAVARRLPLIGRDSELERLRGAIDDARRRSGSLIELVGETGSGKSRLLAEARDLATGMLVVHATCEAFTQQTPYAPWREPLRELLGAATEDPPDTVLARLRAQLGQRDRELVPWLPLLAIAVGVEADPTPEVEQLAPDARAAKLHEVVLRFLAGALAMPTLVQIEHAHVMDAASAALLHALADALEGSAWVVLVTRRAQDSGFAATGDREASIELAPLSVEQSRALAHATPEAALLPPHLVQAAVTRAEGSPEFLLDLLAAATASSAGALDGLPDSVHSAALARIDALEPGDRALVKRAAVLGVSFQPWLLEQVLGADTPGIDERGWERLSGVFARDREGRIRFKRPSMRDAAHASLPFKLRRTLHATVARSIEREDGETADPAALSLHYLLAADHARAHAYALQGAELATKRFSHADAARLYRRAIEAGRATGMVSDPAHRAAIAHAWEQLGDALRCIGEPAAAAQALSAARRLQADDPIAQARLAHRHAEVAERTESLTDAVRWLMRGLRSLEGVSGNDATVWRARSLSFLGGIRNRQGRFTLAAELCRRAIAEAESVGEAAALARACYTLDWALFELGERDQASHSPRALAIYRELGDPEHESTVLNNLGMFAYYDGRWDDAVALYRQAGACSERAGKPGDVAFTDCNVGEILADQGHLQQATAHLERARRVWSATGDRQSVAFVNVLRGRLAVREGRTQDGVALLEEAMSDLRRYRIDAYADLAHSLIAEAEAFDGEPSRALQIVAELLCAGDRQLPLLGRVSGIALARLGRGEEAVTELRRALAGARERSADYEVAATIGVMSMLGAADAELRASQRAIMARLRIEQLPLPSALTSSD